jgi:hypothetical protein
MGLVQPEERLLSYPWPGDHALGETNSPSAGMRPSANDPDNGQVPVSNGF